jgi:hypothetical protein
MRETDQVKPEERRVELLYARQNITGADRPHAQNYEQADEIRYSKRAKPLEIEPGGYARVERTDRESNTVTVTQKSGEEPSYDLRRLQGVNVGAIRSVPSPRGRPGADNDTVARAVASEL